MESDTTDNTDADTQKRPTSKYFDPVDHDGDLRDAIKQAPFYIGRSGGGIIRTGMFGAQGRSITDPGNLTQDNLDEIGTIHLTPAKYVYRKFNQTDFSGKVKFPSVIPKDSYHTFFKSRTRTTRDNPFRRFTMPMYVDTRVGLEDAMETVADRIEQDTDSRTGENATAFSWEVSENTLGDMFRAVYPWGVREQEVPDEDESYETPKPISGLAQTLRQSHRLPDYHVVLVTLYQSTNSRTTPDNPDFDAKNHPKGGSLPVKSSGQFRVLEKEPVDVEEHMVSNARVNVTDENTTYTATFDVPASDVAVAVAGTDRPFRYMDSTDDYAKYLATQNHIKNRNTSLDPRNVTVGVVDTERNDDTIQFTVLVNA